MRICYVCSDLGIPVAGTKGASAHLRGLVRAFTDLGHEVALVTAWPEGAERLGVDVVPIPVSRLADSLPEAVSPRLGRALGHLWNNAAVERALEACVERVRPDLVYERYSPFAVAGGIVAARCGLPHVLEVNSPLAWEGKTYRKQALQDAAEALESTALAGASLIVAVSEELADLLRGDGVPAPRIAVVPNGVDTGLFSPVGPAPQRAAERFVVGFVGSLKRWHGIETLIDAFKLLASDPRFHLLVVGDGPEGRRLDDLASQLPGRVSRPGAVDHAEVPGLLRVMDVAVAPYPDLDRFYFSPLKVLEYMATGRPVVASRIGQLEHLVRDGETGLLVPPGDAVRLASAVGRLADDPALRRRLGKAAAQDARASHAWTSRARDILGLAKQAALAAGPPRRPATASAGEAVASPAAVPPPAAAEKTADGRGAADGVAAGRTDSGGSGDAASIAEAVA